jgi:hypothetical protein
MGNGLSYESISEQDLQMYTKRAQSPTRIKLGLLKVDRSYLSSCLATVCIRTVGEGLLSPRLSTALHMGVQPSCAPRRTIHDTAIAIIQFLGS